MYNSNVLLSAALLLSTCSAAPIEQLPLETKDAAGYPFRKDPYDRKHDTYGDGVQPLPVVSDSCVFNFSLSPMLTASSATVTVQAY